MIKLLHELCLCIRDSVLTRFEYAQLREELRRVDSIGTSEFRNSKNRNSFGCNPGEIPKRKRCATTATCEFIDSLNEIRFIV